MRLDSEILLGFLSDEEKKHFVIFESILTNSTNNKYICLYRTYVSIEKIAISVEEYQLRVKLKDRNNKLNQLLLQ